MAGRDSGGRERVHARFCDAPLSMISRLTLNRPATLPPSQRSDTRTTIVRLGFSISPSQYTYVNCCTDRDDIENTGVYFLFGRNDETDAEQVYIGEAENI